MIHFHEQVHIPGSTTVTQSESGSWVNSVPQQHRGRPPGYAVLAAMNHTEKHRMFSFEDDTGKTPSRPRDVWRNLSFARSEGSVEHCSTKLRPGLSKTESRNMRVVRLVGVLVNRRRGQGFRTGRAITLQRFYFGRLGYFLLLASCVAAAAADQPESVVKLNLTQTVGSFGRDSSIAFLTDELLFISNAPLSPTVVLYDIRKNKLARTGTTCALTGNGLRGNGLWATAGGELLAACSDGLILYDLEFRQIAKFQTHLDYYHWRDTLLLSPTHEFVAINPLSRHNSTKVLATANLTEVASFPSQSVGVESLYKSGYTVATYRKGKDGTELSFYPFLNSQPTLLLENSKNCWAGGFGISESDFLNTCGKEMGEVIETATAHVKLKVAGTKSANFVETSVSGKRFALGFQGYSKAHNIKQLVNPLVYIEALGTCCDDPSNLFRLRVYDQVSGGVVAEFHWKPNEKDPMREKFDNSAVALSPSGEYLAFLHGTAVEVYRIPNSPSP
jgi:hypothetical protein